MNYYLGVDVGTSSVKSLLMDSGGKTVGTSQIGYDIIKEKLQYAEQDMEKLWEATKETITDLVKRYPEESAKIHGISYSGQMHGLVMIGADGKLIRNAIIWADQRSEKEIQKIYDITGKDTYRGTVLNSLSTGFLISSLMWVKEHEPENFEKIRYVVFPKDYIRYKMCGEIGTDMSDASSGAIFDTKKRDWAWGLIEKLQMPKEIFPECYEAYEAAGTVNKECAEQTGLKEGILFIDEINCVSETLAPTMLQFLQCKMFGNQKIPEGWIIVAAGNPPEYNKSVRDFDVVTLDRIKKIDVDVNYDVWKEYAYQADIHPAILAYLEIRRDYFYRMETTVDGRVFATARGWEDLSQLLKTYEKLGKKADREVVHQYIQHWKIAKDFANYLELYRKYKKDYGLEKIIEGVYTKDTLERLQYAAFDERFSVVNMLIGRLGTCFKEYFLKDRFVTILYDYLKLYKSNLQIDLVVCEAREKYEKLRKEEQMTKQEDHVRKQVLDTLESYEQLTKEEHLDGEAAFERVKELFGNEVAGREELTEHTLAALEHAFDFMEAAFGDSQEMVSFVTELNTNYYSIQFLKENDCDKYYQYNKKLLFDKQQEEILSEMEEIEQDLNTVVK